MSLHPKPYKHQYNKLLLRFYEPLESNYLNTRIGQEGSGIRLVFGSLAIINPLFILLDLSRLENPIDSISIRIVLEIIFIAIIIIHYRLKENALGHQILFSSSSTLIYVFLLVSTSISADYYELFIPNCTILLLLVNASFVGLRFRHSIFLNFFIVILYAGYSYWYSEETLHLKQLPFVGIFLIICTILSYLFERKSRALFLKNDYIEDQNRMIEQKNEELSNQNEMKTSLMSILSHDIRSPLSSLELLLKLRSEDVITKEEAFEHFNKIGKSVKSTNAFVGNLILWIKSQMDGFKVKKENVLLKPIIDQIILLCDEQLETKGISIRNEIENDVIILLDKEMSTIVLRNLISNAIKFSHQKSEVTVKLNPNSVVHEILVIDEGVGISEDRMEKLFAMDANNSSFGTKNEQGTGLGLILAYNLMKKMGGDLTCNSQLGKGTTFTIQVEKS